MNCSHNAAPSEERIPSLEANSALSCDTRLSAYSLESSVAQEENKPRIHCFDLPFQILTTSLPFSSGWTVIVRGSALDHVTDINSLPVQAGFAEFEVENFSSPTAKDSSRRRFLLTWGLPEDHYVGVRVTTSHDTDPLSGEMKRAKLTFVVG